MRTHRFFRLLPIAISVTISFVALQFPGAAGEALAAPKNKPPSPPPPPASPEARAWHAMADNGAATSGASRLYIVGGSGSDLQPLRDVWYYRADLQSWIFVPVDSKFGPRQHASLSCGDGQCVIANGHNVGALRETWVYDEASATWSQVNCRRQLCPSARYMATMAYDAARSNHVLFGGVAGVLGPAFGDTYTYANGRWSLRDSAHNPPARRSAAMAYVPGAVAGVVMFGGQREGASMVCDMWAWSGSDWREIQATGNSPCLHGHSMYWSGNRLVVVGGYSDVNGTPNSQAWSFSFVTESSGSWSAINDSTGCFAAALPGAKMAHDWPTGLDVFFGGEQSGPDGTIRYANTLVCG